MLLHVFSDLMHKRLYISFPSFWYSSALSRASLASKSFHAVQFDPSNIYCCAFCLFILQFFGYCSVLRAKYLFYFRFCVLRFFSQVSEGGFHPNAFPCANSCVWYFYLIYLERFGHVAFQASIFRSVLVQYWS